MQSWGYASRFQRRTTGLHPTKSGIIGLIAAAMGIDKHAEGEARRIEELAALAVTAFQFPKPNPQGGKRPLDLRRLEDYHTVEGTRLASGDIDKGTVQTYRQYLLDARFGVLLTGERPLLIRVAIALRDPVWGIWFGRKSCLPALPVLVHGEPPDFVFPNRPSAFQTLLHRAGFADPLPEETEFTRVEEADNFEAGVDTLNDQPVTFAAPNTHTPRRIRRRAAGQS